MRSGMDRKNQMERSMGTSRRAFILGAGAAVGVGFAPQPESVRFCAFADIHYSQDGDWPHGEVAWLDRILRRGEEAKCDFIVSLGDMSFDPVKDRAYFDHYLDFAPVRTHLVHGNHEFGVRTVEEVNAVSRLDCGYHHWDCRGFRFIALDPHYHQKDGRLVHNDRCSYPKEPFSFCVPPEQLDWLERTIDTAPGPCVVLTHERLEDASGGVFNHVAVREVFNRANAKRPGRVRLVINGHEHKDHFRILDDIAYLDLNSATYDVGPKHGTYPPDFCKGSYWSSRVLTWNDPLSAVITMTVDGGLRIEGARSSFYLGITPEKAGWGVSGGRLTTPVIQSVDLKYNYA